MDIRGVIQAQYLSALAMLRQASVKCPPALWNDPGDRDGTWFKAYHALYYAHLYLQAERSEFVRWKGHASPQPALRSQRRSSSSTWSLSSTRFCDASL